MKLASVWKATLVIAALGATLAVIGGPPDARASAEGPGASCSANCDRLASECLDSCEAKFKDDRARVTCKVGCASQRQKCEQECP